MIRLHTVRSAVALVVLAAAGTAIVANAASPPQSLFVSKRYGYTLRLSEDWLLLQIPGRWRGELGDGIPGTDHFTNDKLGIRALIAARAAGSMTLASWTATLDRALPGGCEPHGPLTHVAIAGSGALMRRFRCSDGFAGQQFSIIRDRRAIAIGAVWPKSADEQVAAAGLRHVLATLHFTR